MCAQLCPAAQPVLLPVRVAAHAKPLACFDAVAQQVATRGGGACYGWQVWEWPGLLLEAEFHAVWRANDGELHDITPKREPVSHILFVADPVRRFNGRRIANEYQPLSPHPAVDGFIRACRDEFELTTRAEHAFQRALVLSPWEQEELRAIVERKLSYARTLGML